jgi:hypothetical protein
MVQTGQRMAVVLAALSLLVLVVVVETAAVQHKIAVVRVAAVQAATQVLAGLV